MRISCLHTDPDEIPFYERAAPASVDLAHFVRRDFAYRAHNGPNPALLAETQVYLLRIHAGSDAVLLTGSALATAAQAPARSADYMLAEDLCRRMIEDPAARATVMFSDIASGRTIRDVFATTCDPRRLNFLELPEAQERLAAGDTGGHDALVRDAIASTDADLIALVQPPMGGAAQKGDPRFLTPQTSAFARIPVSRMNMPEGRPKLPIGA
ncbi:MAG: hypothetical protein AAGB10_19185 [Pseudomonadota bacterium]